MTSFHPAICRIFGNKFKRYYLKNERFFLDFSSISEMCMKFKIFWKKRMSFLAYLFPKLLFPKEVATETSRRSWFRTPFGNESVNGFQTPLKVARQHIYPFPPWISGKLSWKKTALSEKELEKDCRWQVFLPQYAEFSSTTSNAFIWKTEDFFWIFYCISEMRIKFRTFWKKGWVS